MKLAVDAAIDGPRRLPEFLKWVLAASAALAMMPAAMTSNSDWSQRQVAQMDAWQYQGIQAGLFTGAAPNETSLIDPRGTHAKINSQLHDSPVVVKEAFFSTVGGAFGPAHGELYDRMTYLHERSHVEYQTGMASRFDALGLSAKDAKAIGEGLARNDHGAYGDLRTRMHGAMHERFAEAYGALCLIHEADAKNLPEVGKFMRGRAQERSASLDQKVSGEFAHDLGRTMQAVVAMDQTLVRGMAPNQLRQAALRIASLSYLADAKGDKSLGEMLGKAMQGPASQALWGKVGSLGGAEIAARATAELPAPEASMVDMAPIKSLVFGSNARQGKPMAVDAQTVGHEKSSKAKQ